MNNYAKQALTAPKCVLTTATIPDSIKATVDIITDYLEKTVAASGGKFVKPRSKFSPTLHDVVTNAVTDYYAAMIAGIMLTSEDTIRLKQPSAAWYKFYSGMFTASKVNMMKHRFGTIEPRRFYYMHNMMVQTGTLPYSMLTVGSNYSKKVSTVTFRHSLPELLSWAKRVKNFVPVLPETVETVIHLDRLTNLARLIRAAATLDNGAEPVNAVERAEERRIMLGDIANIQTATIVDKNNPDRGILHQVCVHGRYGYDAREYLTGTNLRNCKREVRVAAIGECWEYDIDTAVYTWLSNMFDRVCRVMPYPKAIDNTETIRAYIADKRGMRERFSRVAFGDTHPSSISRIKQVLTGLAYGMGKRVKCKMGNTSIADILGGVAAHRLVNDPEFLRLYKQIRVVRRHIADYMDTLVHYADGYIDDVDMADYHIGVDHGLLTVAQALAVDADMSFIFEPVKSHKSKRKLPDAVNFKREFIESKLITYLYQTAESRVIGVIENILQDFCIKPVLTVYDCVYLDQELSPEILGEIESAIAGHADGKFTITGKHHE